MCLQIANPQLLKNTWSTNCKSRKMPHLGKVQQEKSLVRKFADLQFELNCGPLCGTNFREHENSTKKIWLKFQFSSESQQFFLFLLIILR
jgi:hypothetical protein